MILAPWPGIEPAPHALGGESLTTRPQGKSPALILSSAFWPPEPRDRETIKVCYLKSPSLRSFVMVTPGNEPESSLRLTTVSL